MADTHCGVSSREVDASCMLSGKMAYNHCVTAPARHRADESEAVLPINIYREGKDRLKTILKHRNNTTPAMVR
ncbi:hypothetical protein E2C01_040698 [Portunus trituberculatus]|uniref:Uncharacterized protein n=1 Tax=Portunus trituberculatus TaxID=210409 RepID=A0A5B7FN64_PORTR|nr:hypothetical protein [Portunus trituberculatus]